MSKQERIEAKRKAWLKAKSDSQGKQSASSKKEIAKPVIKTRKRKHKGGKIK